MEKNLEKRARTHIRQLQRQALDAGLLLEELAIALGMDVGTLARHVGKGKISTSRARQYMAIVNVAISSGAVHLVIARPKPRRVPGEEVSMEEKRHAVALLDQTRGGGSSRQP